MAMLLDVLSWACIVVGGLFLIAGGIGVLRLPDFYSRLHAAGVVDTLGAGLMLLGLLLQTEEFGVGIRLVLVLAMLLVTVPTATHALARAALHAGQRPQVDEGEDTSSTS